MTIKQTLEVLIHSYTFLAVVIIDAASFIVIAWELHKAPLSECDCGDPLCDWPEILAEKQEIK